MDSSHLHLLHLSNWPVSVQVAIITVFLIVSKYCFGKRHTLSEFPIIALDGKSAKETWLHNGIKAISEGGKLFPGPFQVMTGTGPKIVLPNKYAEDARDHPALDFKSALANDFFVNYPGFEAHRMALTNDTLIQKTVRVKLTQFLGLVTEDLVDETMATVTELFGEGLEWNTILIRDVTATAVARISSRVFLGKDLCRDKRWLEISKTYAIDIFIVSFIMRSCPSFLRPIAYWLIPQSRSIRKAIRDTHSIIDPEMQRRKGAIDEALRDGRKLPNTADPLGWMYEGSRGDPNVDYAAGQLAMNLAAIHTTTETTCTALLDICEYPDLADRLRKEIVEVISEFGWTKTSLYKLRLMDSFLKESQRFRPFASASMQRAVTEDAKLSDGTVLPKGSTVIVAANYMDPDIYEDPEKFDPARFLDLREQTGHESTWQFVSPTPAHLLFGYGRHACPGRFFAANEIKVLLSHLLLLYDWRFLPGEGRPPHTQFEASLSIDANTKLQCRRRKPESCVESILRRQAKQP